MENRKKHAVRAGALVLACGFLVCGIYRGETAVVFEKAVNICLECIGLG